MNGKQKTKYEKSQHELIIGIYFFPQSRRINPLHLQIVVLKRKQNRNIEGWRVIFIWGIFRMCIFKNGIKFEILKK